MVKLLEDSNESVRSLSKQVIVDLYKSTKLEALQSHVLKEIAKQNIRQTIADSITAQLSSIHAVSDSGISSDTQTTPKPEIAKTPSHIKKALLVPDTQKEQIVVISGTAAPQPVPLMISSNKELEQEMQEFLSLFQGKETEQNWVNRENMLQKFRCLIRGNASQFESFLLHLKSVTEQIVISSQSLRSALILTSCTVMEEMAVYLESKIDSVTEIIIPGLIKLSGASKKLVFQAVLTTMKSIVSFSTFQPKHVNLFVNALFEKSPSVRQASAEILRLLLEILSGELDLQKSMEKSNMIEKLEKGISKAITDSDGTTRSLGRDAFYYFNLTWPQRANM